MNRASESKASSWKDKLGLTGRDGPQAKFVGQPDDLIIITVGLTGAGKSSFIRDYTGNHSVVVGHLMEPCTRDVTWYLATMPPSYAYALGRCRLILVDTPGFDDPYPQESRIYRRVSRWLTESYGPGKSVTGIVYIHDITLRRKFDSQRIDITSLTSLCGVIDCKKLVLATSKWDCLSDPLIGSQREQELRGSLWAGALRRGATVLRIERKPDDLHTVINHLLDSRLGSKPRPLAECGKNPLGISIAPDIGPTGKRENQRPARGDPSTNIDTPRSDDILIAIMGQTGAGKSTFINGYLGEKKAEVGSGLTQCTRHISRYAARANYPRDGRRTVLVDTPGLDDIPSEHNDRVLQRLASWMATSCSTGASLAGVIYLQDICKQKSGRPGSLTHLQDFKRLARTSFSNPSLEFAIALVTTQWDEVEQQVGIRREGELKSSIWKELIDEGASVYRADRGGCQAWIVKQVLGRP